MKGSFLKRRPQSSNVNRVQQLHEVIWANYGVQIPVRYPLAISTSYKICVTANATSVVGKNTMGRHSVSFESKVVNLGIDLHINSLSSVNLKIQSTKMMYTAYSFIARYL